METDYGLKSLLISSPADCRRQGSSEDRGSRRLSCSQSTTHSCVKLACIWWLLLFSFAATFHLWSGQRSGHWKIVGTFSSKTGRTRSWTAPISRLPGKESVANLNAFGPFLFYILRNQTASDGLVHGKKQFQKRNWQVVLCQILNKLPHLEN